MKLTTRPNTVAASLALLLLSATLAACSPSAEPVAQSLPEVNDQNCAEANVRKIEPESLRRQFGSLCFKRGDFKPSAPRAW